MNLPVQFDPVHLINAFIELTRENFLASLIVIYVLIVFMLYSFYTQIRQAVVDLYSPDTRKALLKANAVLLPIGLALSYGIVEFARAKGLPSPTLRHPGYVIGKGDTLTWELPEELRKLLRSRSPNYWIQASEQSSFRTIYLDSRIPGLAFPLSDSENKRLFWRVRVIAADHAGYVKPRDMRPMPLPLVPAQSAGM